MCGWRGEETRPHAHTRADTHAHARTRTHTHAHTHTSGHEPESLPALSTRRETPRKTSACALDRLPQRATRCSTGSEASQYGSAFATGSRQPCPLGVTRGAAAPTTPVTERDYKGSHALPSNFTREGHPITRDCPPSLLILQGWSLTAAGVQALAIHHKVPERRVELPAQRRALLSVAALRGHEHVV